MPGEQVLTERLDLRLSVELADTLRIVAARTGHHRGFVVREALRRHLAELALDAGNPVARNGAPEDHLPIEAASDARRE
jgi:hypothetical protein